MMRQFQQGGETAGPGKMLGSDKKSGSKNKKKKKRS
jgi:hypothetical protein